MNSGKSHYAMSHKDSNLTHYTLTGSIIRPNTGECISARHCIKTGSCTITLTNSCTSVIIGCCTSTFSDRSIITSKSFRILSCWGQVVNSHPVILAWVPMTTNPRVNGRYVEHLQWQFEEHLPMMNPTCRPPRLLPFLKD